MTYTPGTIVSARGREWIVQPSDAELLDRGEIERACVLCPPPLVDQWVSELNRHFHIVAKAVTASSAASLERSIPDQSLTIFQYYPFIVVSLDYIKSDAHAAMFKQSAPEFVIVDEAHTCTQQGSGRQRRWQLVKALAEDTNRHMVFATATPHSGNQLAFANLLSLLKPEFAAFADPSRAETQSRRGDVLAKFCDDGRAGVPPPAAADGDGTPSLPSSETAASASSAQTDLCASALLREYLPLYEAKMIHQFDHLWTTYESGETDVRDVTLSEKQNVAYEPRPRYWVERKHVEEKFNRAEPQSRREVGEEDGGGMMPAAANAEIAKDAKVRKGDSEALRSSANFAFFASAPAGSQNPVNPVNPVEKDLCASVSLRENNLPRYLMGWRDITNAIAVRTVIATVLPCTAVGNKIPLIQTCASNNLNACLLGELNSLIHDWCARQKVGGITLNFFLIKQFPTLSPTAYTQADIDFIVPRVLELTYTSNSLKPWAEALGYTGVPFKFDSERRAALRAELDARYAKLYGLNEPELTYILDPSAVYGPDYPSESFRVLKEKEIAEFGEYRTMRMVLEAFRKDAR